MAFPGADRALVNLSKNSGLTEHFSLTSSGKENLEIDFFLDLIREKRPRLVIFGGWSDTYNEFLKRLKREKIEFGVYWTSGAGQIDISQELDRFIFVIKNKLIKYKFFTNEKFISPLAQHMDNVYYLPATTHLPQLKLQQKVKRKKILIISLFCSPLEYKRKNILNCLLALSMLNKGYVLYLNGLSQDKYYKNVLEILDIRYKDFGWMKRDKYEKVLSEIDLGLQISFAETFNYVAAEHIARGIPVVTSLMVPVMHAMTNESKKRLLAKNVDDPQEIKEKIEYLIRHQSKRIDLGKKLFHQLKKENSMKINIANRILKMCESKKIYDEKK